MRKRYLIYLIFLLVSGINLHYINMVSFGICIIYTSAVSFEPKSNLIYGASRVFSSLSLVVLAVCCDTALTLSLPGKFLRKISQFYSRTKVYSLLSFTPGETQSGTDVLSQININLAIEWSSSQGGLEYHIEQMFLYQVFFWL